MYDIHTQSPFEPIIGQIDKYIPCINNIEYHIKDLILRLHYKNNNNNIFSVRVSKNNELVKVIENINNKYLWEYIRDIMIK